MKYDELIKQYETVKLLQIEDVLFKEAKEIVGRGYTVCNNDEIGSHAKDILVLCGINPGGTTKPERPYSFQNATDSNRSHYWRKKHNQFGGRESELVKHHMAYFDLLPIIESKQNKLERVFKPYSKFRFELVEKTAKAIEDLSPRLIIHANKNSLYYWGLNPVTLMQDLENPWLGYTFKDVTRECPTMVDYKKRIEGKTEDKEYVFLFEISGRGLKAKTYFLSYTMERYGMKPWQRVQLLSPEEMQGIWEWCCKQ